MTSHLPLPVDPSDLVQILLSDGKWYEVSEFTLSPCVVFVNRSGKDVRLDTPWFSAQAYDRAMGESMEDDSAAWYTLSGPTSSIIAYQAPSHQ